MEFIEKPTPEIIRFLEETAWGSSGLQYYVRRYADALGRIPDPQFFAERDAGVIAGVIMFFVKEVAMETRRMKIAYLTQLSVRPERRGQGLAGRLVRAVRDHLQAASLTESFGITAYIDDANTPSLAVFRKQGFSDLGQFHATIINRVWPNASPRVTSLEAAESGILIDALSGLYADHILQDFETSLHVEDYRVIRDPQGTILAGLQAHPEEWRVTHMEGVGGWLVVHGISRVRWLRDHLFNPEASRFLHIGNLYARPGHESLLYTLIEDALARAQVPFAVAYLDKRSPFRARFAAAGSFGFLNSQMETPVRIMGWFTGLTDQERIALSRRPVCVSPLDIT